MTVRLMIVTPIVAPYRTASFEALGAAPDVDLTVVYAARSDPNRDWSIDATPSGYRQEVLREVGHFRYVDNYAHLSIGLLPLLRRVRPHVIVAGGWDQPVNLEALALRRWFGCGFAWWVEATRRDIRSSRSIARSAKRRLVAAADAVLVPGTAAAAYIGDLGARLPPVVIAPNAVDNARFRSERNERRRDALRYLTVGRLERHKGVLDLIDAWRRAGIDGRLSIVGTGPLAARVADLVGADPAIDVVGHLQPAEVVEAYRRADVFVFASRSDPWGFVLNEAMAAGLPVITTSAPGAVEDLVEDGVNGRVVPPGQVGTLADAIRALADDPSMRDEMAARSSERIARFTPERWAASVRALALELQERRRSR